MATEFVKTGRDARILAFVDRPVDATRAVAAWARRGRRPAPLDSGVLGVAPHAPRPALRGRRRGEGIERGGLSFADLIESLPGLNLEAPSDYGRAFHALLHSHLRPGGRDSVLVVLGDARTNRFDPLPWAVEEISRRARAVLWLVPEPRSRWGTADSALADYLPHADAVVEARDL
ncbi:MAG: VWA domain-containing protein, partial [Acidobacteriia bacterium]|nr:VWA domain-containing protein [Terriglobia bacterium]